MRHLSLKIFLILAFGLFSVNSNKGGIFTVTLVRYGIPVLALGTYVLYKRYVRRRMENRRRMQRLQTSINTTNKNISNLEKSTKDNFNQTKKRIENSKDELIVKIKKSREKLEKFVDKRATDSEGKIMSVITVVKVDLLKRLTILKMT